MTFPVRSLPCLLAALFVAGCATGPAPHAPGPAAAGDATPPQAAVAAPGTTVLHRVFNGTIVARVPGERVGQGADSEVCFDVPDGTTRLRGVLTWSPSTPMGLEFQHRRVVVASSSDGDLVKGLMTTQGPVEVTVDAPEAGSGWYAYAGPGVAGADTTWSLDLEWTVQGTGATLDATAAGPCG